MIVGVNGRFLGAPVTGVQRFGREVLTGIDAGARVVLLLPRGVDPPSGLGGEVVAGRTRGQAWEQLELTQAARAAGCDVVLHPANSAPWRAHRSVVVVHDVFPLTNPEWFTRRYALWHRNVMAPALRRASALLTVSEWSRVQIAQQLRVRPDRIGVVPQGLGPFDAPAVPEEVARARATYGLPPRYAVAFGGREPRKNVRFLGPVAERFEQLRPDVPIVVMGDGHARVHPADREVVERPNLRLVGQVEPTDAHALLTGAAALLFPSLAEGFGRPPLEALACGTPALVGAYGPALEVLGSAEHILPWDPGVWAAKLDRILDDASARARALAQAAQLRQRCTWERACEVVLDACERVARSRTDALVRG